MGHCLLCLTIPKIIMAKTLVQVLVVLMCMIFSFAKSRLFKGKVTDDSNIPLENASVTVWGFAKVTRLMADGFFSIGLPV